jgi:hypothetical protein
MDVTTRSARRPRAAVILLAALVLVVCLELIASVGFGVVGSRRSLMPEPAFSGLLTADHRRIIHDRIVGKSLYLDYSAALGWTIKPHGRSGLYQANSHGMRSSREYSIQPPASVIRIAVFGDSFTHGDDVSNADAWPRQLEDLSPNLEVLNFGVGGYGTDQALLRYETEGARFRPHVVLMGFHEENIHRVVSVFRLFYFPTSGLPMSKPRFVMRDGAAVLVPNPIPTREGYRALLDDPARETARLGEHDYHYHRSFHYHWTDVSRTARLVRLLAHNSRPREGGIGFNHGSEAFQVLTAIYSRFEERARKAGSRPIALVHPDAGTIETYRKRRVRSYDPLLSYFAARGIEYIDLLDAFEKYGLDKAHSLYAGHYTAEGNRVVAEYLSEALVARGVIPPPSPQASGRRAGR